MKYLLFALFAISLSANTAEFSLNDSIIKSSIVVNETQCAGYSILVKDDRFPDEVYGKVPEEYGIPGYLGASGDLIVSVHVFVKIGSIEKEVPSVIEKYQKMGKLLTDDGRVYLPRQGYCLSKNSFLLSVDSGGSCGGCEALIKYNVNKNGSIIAAGFPSGVEVKKALGR
ncbi:hypothetical protein [Methylomonas sp. UP202]|uniref:hypothetical protein n=1 Tax=Methylomonas sp. UP202 TaxID=3040943 RepID=UPI0024799FC4|nr:hypothetical protein [Methylomonas sp. UP202]WGS86190.1 hypothetical protein QC632_00165 [Methylomonas sp. UP202]